MSNEYVTLDPAELERRIVAIAASSTDPAAAEQLASIAHTLLAALQEYHKLSHKAWELLGRADMAFELITEAQLLGPAKKTAKQLRAEIAKASGK